MTATSAGYRLDTGDGRTFDAERVVVTAGGWLPALLDRLPLPAGFRALVPPLQVTQENAFHFPYREEETNGWPTFIHRTPAIRVYGLPGGRDAGFRGQKIAEFLGGRRIASAADQDGVVDPANRARIVDYVRQYLPGLVPEPYAETTCLFTSTPERRLPRRRGRRHHAGLPLLRPRRQVRPADRRHRRRRGHRRRPRPGPVHRSGVRDREPRRSGSGSEISGAGRGRTMNWPNVTPAARARAMASARVMVTRPSAMYCGRDAASW